MGDAIQLVPLICVRIEWIIRIEEEVPKAEPGKVLTKCPLARFGQTVQVLRILPEYLLQCLLPGHISTEWMIRVLGHSLQGELEDVHAIP